MQGRKKALVVGQVGLRCRHSAPYPLRARGRGAVYYLAKMNSEYDDVPALRIVPCLFCSHSRDSPLYVISGIYQAAQNKAGSHLCQSCQQNPIHIKQELQRLLEKRDNANGGKQYWSDGCMALGVYETDSGLRLGSKDDDKNSKDANT